jgi:hypothetical protein
MVAQVDFGESFQRFWDEVIAFLPNLGAFLLILVVGYLVAKLLEKILDRVLERVGFDRVVERGGVKQALERSRYDASSILAKIVFYTVFLIVLQMAFDVFGDNAISELLAGLIAFLPKLFVAVLIVVITAAVATGTKTIIESTLGGLSYGRILAGVAMGAVWVVGIAAALNQVEVAPEIVNGLFYGLLALVVGSGIVAIGGGAIQPMRHRIERGLNKIEVEAPQIRQEAKGSTEQLKQQADEIRRDVPSSTRGPTTQTY